MTSPTEDVRSERLTRWRSFQWHRLRKLRPASIALAVTAIGVNSAPPANSGDDALFLSALSDDELVRLDALLRLLAEVEIRR